jgi:hypothetical protein
MRTTLRLFAFLAWLFSPGLYFGAAAATHVDWSGSWDTRWRDGGARLDLRQSGDVVNGTYPLYEGAVEAVANSRELTGKWMAGPRSGSFTFVMGLDGRTFVGRYDNGEWWTGARLSEAAPTLPVDRSDVRVGRSFRHIAAWMPKFSFASAEQPLRTLTRASAGIT